MLEIAVELIRYKFEGMVAWQHPKEQQPMQWSSSLSAVVILQKPRSDAKRTNKTSIIAILTVFIWLFSMNRQSSRSLRLTFTEVQKYYISLPF
jgi:hypothetical protein